MSFVKLNWDGCFKGNPGLRVGGCLLRDASGSIIWAQADFGIKSGTQWRLRLAPYCMVLEDVRLRVGSTLSWNQIISYLCILFRDPLISHGALYGKLEKFSLF